VRLPELGWSEFSFDVMPFRDAPARTQGGMAGLDDVPTMSTPD
jgi:hypothetical protein